MNTHMQHRGARWKNAAEVAAFRGSAEKNDGGAAAY